MLGTDTIDVLDQLRASKLGRLINVISFASEYFFGDSALLRLFFAYREPVFF